MECVGEGGREGWANEVVYASLESMAFSDFLVGLFSVTIVLLFLMTSVWEIVFSLRANGNFASCMFAASIHPRLLSATSKGFS
jgi:hypothetical protein